MTPIDALKTAIALTGGQINFAKTLTKALAIRGDERIISQQIVSYWTRSARGLPAQYCIDVEELPSVNFQITRHQLRPDVFGATPYVPVEDVAA